MQLRNKIYPYPVLMEGNSSYENSVFTTEVNDIKDGYNLRLKFKCNLTDDKLLDLLKDGLVIYAHHIECPQTCFRRIVKTSRSEDEIILRDQDVSGVIQVCSFIMANADIEKYDNPNFSRDYKGFKFNMDKGCVVGIGNQFQIIVNKIKDDLKNTQSIFSVIPNTAEDASRMLVTLTSQKIIVSLPKKTYYQYTYIQDAIDMQPMMHGLVIIPALMYTFTEMIRDADDLEDIYGGFRWYRSLKKTCKTMDILLTADSLKEMKIIETVQILMNNPIINAINVSATGGGVHED